MCNKKSKKLISAVLALALLLCSWVSASADSDVPVQVEDADLFITDEAAEQLALFFISDMAEAGQAAWDETTKPTRVVPMYDETGENVTAYTVELTSGYVVVSAYADVPNLFFEWADEAEPVYADLADSPKTRSNTSGEEKIVYVGPLGYYLDNGTDTLLGAEGEEVPREALSNDFDEFRDIDNVSPEAIEMIVESKEEAAGNGGISPLADNDNTPLGYITNTPEYARKLLGGTWKCTSWNNKWESAANFAVMSSFSGYRKHCGLVAITNAIKMYGNQYNNNYIKGLSNHDVFKKVVEVNQLANKKYYEVTQNADGEYEGGTHDKTADEFIVKSFKKCGVTVNTYGEDPYKCTIENVKNATTADRLMYIMLHKYGKPYGNHHVIGYAWACLTDNSFQFPRDMYFLKICDGHKSSARALDMSRLKNDSYWEIKF